jgi:hypothetical protein
MDRGANIKLVSVLLCFSLMLLYFPNIAKAEGQRMGSLIGFIFSEDGTTPVKGAVVTLRNVSTGEIYKSSGTDDHGVFKVEEMPKGLYVMGVSSANGDYNAEELVGVHSGKTGKLSVTLKTYDEQSQQAAENSNKEKNNKGEVLVGRIISYEPNTKLAVVEIIKGQLREDDEIHALGPEDISETDFYQTVKVLTLNDKPIKKAQEGQIVVIWMDEDVVEGDLVYLLKRKGIPPIFLIPIGAALVIGTVTFSNTDDTPDDVTAIRK